MSKYQWIFTKQGMFLDIVEIWFRIVHGQILSVFEKRYLPATCLYFHFQTITVVNINRFSPNLVCALILWRSGLGLFMGKFHKVFNVLPSTHNMIVVGYYHFTFLLVILITSHLLELTLSSLSF